MENKYNTYEGYKYDNYIGHRLYKANCTDTRNGVKTFRIRESMLVRNTEGVLGFVGEGIKWGMNWLTESGACCFNPIDESELVWSYAHNAYVYETQTEHFEFPIRMGQFYQYNKGKKTTGLYPETKVPKLPKGYCTFTETRMS